eukprot:SAG22_NODE_9405_length_591_cov_0.939024_1_plen_190_part_10
MTTCPMDALTDQYIEDGSRVLMAALKLLDHAFPGRFVGVHLAALHTGEWFFPNSCPGDGPGYMARFAGYSNFTLAAYCGSKSDCSVPTTKQRMQPAFGNTFVGPASADFNLWLSQRVVRAISAFSAAIKSISQGHMLAGAFYGYLWALDGWVISGSGHLALTEMLADPNVDFHVSPYNYLPGGRNRTGGM